MALKNLKHRFGTGAGGPNLEDGLTWLAEHDFHFTDFNADHGKHAHVRLVRFRTAHNCLWAK